MREAEKTDFSLKTKDEKRSRVANPTPPGPGSSLSADPLVTLPVIQHASWTDLNAMSSTEARLGSRRFTSWARCSSEPEDSHQDRGERHEKYNTANFRERLSPRGAGQHFCLRLLAGRYFWSGTSWKISTPSARSCRFSIFLCRRRWTTWRTPRGSWISRWPSRLSKFPSSLAHRVLLVLFFLSRSQWNSWWKCRTSCILCASRSRSSAFQFLRVVASGKFKVLSGQSSTATLSFKKRFSERIVEQIVDIPGGGPQGFRPGQGSPASSSFVSPAGSVDDANEPGEACEVGFALESKGARQCQPIQAGCSAGGRALAGLHRVGAAQGTLRWQDLLLEQTYKQYSLVGTSWCRGRVDRRKE